MYLETAKVPDNLDRELRPLKVGEPFDRVGIDIVDPFKDISENNNSYIVIATEYLTNCSRTLLLDQDYSFCNKIVDALCEIIAIRYKLSAVYYLQTNRLTEKFNKTLCLTLAKLTNIKKAQEKQKGYYDKSLKPIKFKIEDQVLLYELAKEK
ncbi:14986_t:CDS:2, partial [Dentiscutata heterogama]